MNGLIFQQQRPYVEVFVEQGLLCPCVGINCRYRLNLYHTIFYRITYQLHSAAPKPFHAAAPAKSLSSFLLVYDYGPIGRRVTCGWCSTSSYFVLGPVCPDLVASLKPLCLFSLYVCLGSSSSQLIFFLQGF